MQSDQGEGKARNHSSFRPVVERTKRCLALGYVIVQRHDITSHLREVGPLQRMQTHDRLEGGNGSKPPTISGTCMEAEKCCGSVSGTT